MSTARRGPRRPVTPRESRVVVVSPELVELVRELREHFAWCDLVEATTENRFLADYMRGETNWIAAAIVLHPAVGPQVQIELRPSSSLRSLLGYFRERARRGAELATGTEGSR